MQVTRAQTLAFRWRAQQLDAPAGSTTFADLAVLDLGVQDGANQAGLGAFVNRGIAVADAQRVTSGPSDELVLAWTLRGAPHFYRRGDIAAVAGATAPFTDEDALARSAGAGKVLTAAGIGGLTALADVARAMRAVTTKPAGKGEVSGRLRDRLDDPYLVDCRPCGVVHPHEQLFRLAALAAGLELEPGTNPPTLHRIAGWRRPRRDPSAAPERLQVIRGYLRLLGPSTPADVAAFLEAPTAVVKANWPGDAEEVRRDGTKAWVLPDDLAALEAAEPTDDVRLLGAFDLFTAAKDRPLLVPDAAHRKELWPVLGRPGALAIGGELVGTWRPKTTRDRLTVRLHAWRRLPAGRRAAIEEAAVRLAESRGQTLAEVIGE